MDECWHGWLAGWLAGALAGWLAGWLDTWLGGLLAGWLAGSLTGWLPTQKAAALAAEVIALGAVHVEEMTPDEWQQLSAWAQLLPFEQRRLLKHL